MTAEQRISTTRLEHVPAQRSDVASALAAAAQLMQGPDTRDETLAAVVQAARSTVPGVDGAAVSMLVDRHLVCVAASDERGPALARIQAGLDEGPCLDASKTHGPVLDDLRAAPRWPRYAGQARESGLRSELAIGLDHHDQTLGVLHLYSARPGSIHHATVRVAELFAVHAALALANAAPWSGSRRAPT